MQTKTFTVEDFYAFKIKNMWSYFKGQHFSFWMICCYLFVEFVRPQSIIPALDVLPWAMLFILLSAVGALMDPTVKWVSSGVNSLMFLFLFVIVVSIVFAQYPDVSKKEFKQFFNWFLIYFLIINIVNTSERFYIFFLVLLLSSAKIAIGTAKIWVMRGFSFASWGITGPPGFFQNSGELAILMLILFPLVFYFYQTLKNRASKWEKFVLVICCAAPVLTILGASSRGAQVALVAQLIIMFRKSIFKVKPFFGIVALCVMVFYLLPQEQKDRFSSIGEDKTSEQRKLYWQHGWEMMKDRPFVGVGFFNFIPYYEDNFPEDMLYSHAELPHNIFIQVGTDAGFIAVFIFSALILYCIFLPVSLKPLESSVNRSIAVGLSMGVLGFAVAGQFVTVAYYPYLWINLSFLVAVKNIERKALHL